MIENNDTLKQLFDGFKPELSSSQDFMDELDRRLEAVEYIKQQQEKQLRYYRYAVVAALLLGLICGAILFAFVIMMTDVGPLFTFDTRVVPLIFLQENSRMLALVLIAGLMTYGIVTLLSMVGPIIANGKHYRASR